MKARGRRTRGRSPSGPMPVGAHDLAASVGFQILGCDLGRDLDRTIRSAMSNGVVFSGPQTSLGIFRCVLAASIRDIQSHPRGRLFREFVRKGPYENTGAIPAHLVDRRLTDAETASVVSFVHGHMVNSFKGAIAELLAVRACHRLLRRLQRSRAVPRAARLYVGDAVLIRRRKGRGTLKGADLHIIAEGCGPRSGPTATVLAVVEVKAYRRPIGRMREQLDRHLRRVRLGLQICSSRYGPHQVNVGLPTTRKAVRVSVLPHTRTLPRSFRSVRSGDRRILHVEPGVPPTDEDSCLQLGPRDWQIALKWSHEALSEAAYEMSFWYMGKIGEVVYGESRPKEWAEMSAAEAGRNAVKQMLYYAILRSRTAREQQRAVSLYNAYGFGYALGMNFRNAEGRREMLWPRDLDEIHESGRTATGCRITPAGRGDSGRRRGT